MRASWAIAALDRVYFTNNRLRRPAEAGGDGVDRERARGRGNGGGGDEKGCGESEGGAAAELLELARLHPQRRKAHPVLVQPRVQRLPRVHPAAAARRRRPRHGDPRGAVEGGGGDGDERRLCAASLGLR